MSLSSTSLPRPKNWQDFEYGIWVLISCELDDPNAQRNGRSGQGQDGVDIYGYRNRKVDCLVGVQCKKKFDKQVTEDELKSEVEKAKFFVPKLTEFILVTTAPRDKNIQEVARQITLSLANTDHPIQVYVWGWDDVEERASRHADVWKAFDSTWSPFTEKISVDLENIKSLLSFGKMFPTNRPGPESVAFIDNENTPLHGQVTALQRLVDDGIARTALNQLLKLKCEEWAKASRSERYSILVSIASAKLKLGDYDSAGTFLQDAYNEFPEHKNALKNLANGYLLVGNYKEALKLARNMLAENETNAYAAGILIQSLINYKVCNNPLEEVPKALRNSEEVLVANILFQRQRSNPDWLNIAKTASKTYPENQTLKLLSAEAVLDTLVRDESDVLLGGILKNISVNELNIAVETLYLEATNALEKECILLPSIANNAALALRFSGEITKAKQILDASIKLFPGDENICLQRAVIAYDENDPKEALKLLPKKPSNPEEIALVVASLIAIGNVDDAISLTEDIDILTLPESVRRDILAARVRSYIDTGKSDLAVATVNQQVEAEPNSLIFRSFQIQTCRIVKDFGGANQALEKALELVDDRTELALRLEFSFEARKLKRDDLIIDLLKDRMTPTRDSEGLRLLITAAVNSGFWSTARKILNSISPSLRGKEWFQKGEAILAINTGDASAEENITRYLHQCPNDVEMIFALIGIWQRKVRNIDIKCYLQALNLASLVGRPEKKIRLAALICHYENFLRGLRYGYLVLMDNWDNPEAHLAYQALVFLSEGIKAALPSANAVEEDTIVCLKVEDGERLCRIEGKKHIFFEDERVNPESDLAQLLIDKRPGDKIKLQDRVGSKEVEVLWVKSVYLDALHRSLEQFNIRFPLAKGLQKFTFDPDALDPMEDIREITKDCTEANQRILEEYRSKILPLSFVAELIGKDPIEVWSGLPSVGIEFRVCHGILQERLDALKTISDHSRKGCVLDAVTLSVVRRLGVEKAIIAVCGPIYVPQSVVDLVTLRAMEARQNVEKEQGFLVWQDGKLVYEKSTRENREKSAIEREEEASWVKKVATVAPTIPKHDFSPNVRWTVDIFGQAVCDPAIVADGSSLLLLSEDMGYRVWSTSNFNIPTTWLQPVLISARNKGYLSTDTFCKAINLLALNGHNFTSLDLACLMHQARKDNFLVTKELSRLLGTVGGKSADLRTNSRILSTFIDGLWKECSDELKIKRITSEVFYAFTKGRPKDLRGKVALILIQIQKKERVIFEHALNWLIGHSFGMDFYSDLLQMKQDLLGK